MAPPDCNTASQTHRSMQVTFNPENPKLVQNRPPYDQSSICHRGTLSCQWHRHADRHKIGVWNSISELQRSMGFTLLPKKPAGPACSFNRLVTPANRLRQHPCATPARLLNTTRFEHRQLNNSPSISAPCPLPSAMVRIRWNQLQLDSSFLKALPLPKGMLCTVPL